jgi:hypothetical protein
MPLIDGFNTVREEVVVPGAYLCVDECMSQWEGKESNYDPNGHPSVIKIARKPKGVGSEFKSLADGETGMLLRLDPRESKEIMRTKPYAGFGAGTAAPLRLTRHLWGSNRCLVGDSAFASLKLSQILREKRMYFHGIVKTAHTGFPKTWCQQWLDGNPSRGEWVGFHHKDDSNADYYGCVWKDSKGKMIISNCSSLHEGEPAKKRRHKRGYKDGREVCLIVEKEVKRPKMVEDVFKYFSVIDVHDHYRQGSLSLESTWKTTKWWHRVFATIYGMTITDAFLASRYEYSKNFSTSVPHVGFTDFLDKLCYLMINNFFLETESAVTRTSSAVNLQQRPGD